MTPPRFSFRRGLACVAAALALVVVVLGAYVRLSNAGLSCPDWPGCYGHLTVAAAEQHAVAVDHAYPSRPLEPAKARKEMVHRYAAGTLGLLILALAVGPWPHPEQRSRHLSLALLGLVTIQALLGMWTVTLRLAPVVVTAHLVGGMVILALLWVLVLRGGSVHTAAPAPAHLRWWALAGLTVLCIQIALGGWTSANHAALACPDFPTCRGQWWPPADFAAGFSTVVSGSAALTAIQLAHRLGAALTLVVLLCLAWRACVSPRGGVRVLGVAVAVLVLVQVSLGIANVLEGLPLVLAVAHNAVAALLLLSVLTLNTLAWRGL